MLKGDELVWWGLTVMIPPTKQRIGSDRLNRVLAALAMYANAEGVAWPAAATIGKSLGLDRRVIRDAFGALEEVGLISRAPSPSKSIAWRLNADGVAGMPAPHPRLAMAGIPATQVAGDVAGDVAGNLARIPATNRREEKKTRAHTRTRARRPHIHVWESSGYCGCGERDDGRVAEGAVLGTDRRSA